MSKLISRTLSNAILLLMIPLLLYLPASIYVGKAARQDVAINSPEAVRNIAYENVESILGSIRAISGGNQIVYAGLGDHLQVINVNSPNNPRSTSRPLRFPALIQDLYLEGDRLVSLTGAGSISVIDVSDPLVPTLLGSLDLNTTISFVYSMGELIFAIDTTNILYVIDVSNPAAMVELGSLILPGHVYSVEGLGSYLYASCGDQGLVIVDITSPQTPVQVNTLNMSGDERYLVIAGGKGYSISYTYDSNTFQFDTRLHVIDFSNPIAPVEVSWLNVNAFGEIAVQGNYAYISFFGNLSVVDVSDAQNLKIVNYYSFAFSISDLQVVGSLGYIMTEDGGLQILDLSDPEAPEFVGYDREVGNINAAAFSGRYAYLLDNDNSRIRIVDLASMGSVLVATRIEARCLNTYLYLSGGYLYFACNNSVIIFDVGTPTKPVRLGSISTSSLIRDMAVSGTRLYVLSFQSLLSIDVSNPALPVLTGSLVTDADKIEASGDMVYLVRSYKGMFIVDASDPAAMSVVGSLEYFSRILNLAVQVPYVYLSLTYDANYGGANALIVIDVAQSNNPVLATYISLPPSPTGINLIDGRLLISHSNFGLLEFGLNDPKNPALLNDLQALAMWTTYPAEQAYAIDDQVVLASPLGGLNMMKRVWTDRSTVQPDSQSIPALDGKVTYSFPPGSLAGTTTLINLERPTAAGLDGIMVAGPVFKASILETENGQALQPSDAFSMTVEYDSTRLGVIAEESIGLYVLDGCNWILESGNNIITTTHSVSASPSRLGTWAVFGEERARIYLPQTVSNFTSLPDLRIDGIEATQAVNRSDLFIPLVADRPTVLRVYVSSDLATPVNDVMLSVSASLYNTPLPGSPITIGPWAIFPDPYKRHLSDSFNFSLPAEWLNGNVTVDVKVNPLKAVPETSYLNNAQSLTLSFNSMPPLDYKIVPVDYTDSSGELHPGPTADTMTADIWRMYPLHQINTSLRLSFPWSGDLSEGAEWGRFLDDLTDLKYSDEAPDSTAYYGAVKEAGDLAWGGMGWIGLRASVGIDGSGTAAHELGHNFGRDHAPCGVDGDEDYPYPDGIIGQWGFDVYSNQVFAPSEYKDFMSYCGPKWVSDYTYLGLYEDQRENGFASSAEAAPGSYYWIRLRFAEDGKVTLKPVYILGKAYPLEGESSGYTAVLLDEDGAAIQSFALPLLQAVSEGSEHTGVFATLPVPENGAGAIVIEKDGQEITRQALDPGDGQNLPEQAAVTKEPDGWRLSWREAGTAARVRVSTDGGQTWTTLALDLTASEFKIAETPEVAAGAWLEVSFSNRSLPERVVLSAE